MEEMSEEYNQVFESGVVEHTKSYDGEGENFKSYSVKSIHNMQFHSSVFAKTLMNDRLLDALEDIMNSKNILLHHTKANFKPQENGAPYLMHQDYHYFPFRSGSMVAAFIHLDDSTPENGGLCIYPGSHILGPQEDKGSIKHGEEYHYLDQTLFPLENATPLSAKRGDVVVLSYLLIRGSYLNLSTRPRRLFLMQLMAAEDKPTRKLYESPGQGWVLRGKNVTRKDDNIVDIGCA